MVIPLTMAINTLAIAEMTELMARPIAENTEPCVKTCEYNISVVVRVVGLP